MTRSTKLKSVVLLAGLSVAVTACQTTGPTTHSSYSTVEEGVETLMATAETEWAIAIHGGAGVRSRNSLTPELERSYRETLDEALRAAAARLNAGEDGAEAVVAAITVLEDSPLFNAGIGGALDERGDVVHDASIMRGDNRDAGAVAGSRQIKNPITAAHRMMEDTGTVLLTGEGADDYAKASGLDMMDPADFVTERRRRLLERARKRARSEASLNMSEEILFGTVGAVVLDKNGNIFAGTSTGGRTNKRFGRIGDSPVIGAGTYAANESCAVSATGHGEWFMRYTVARDICARMEWGDETLPDAARAVIMDGLKPLGGSGAVISLTPDGDVVFAMNGNGMYRGVARSDMAPKTGIYAIESVK